MSLRTRALLGLVPSQSQADCCPTGEDNLRPFPKALLSDLLSSLAEKKGVGVLFLPPPSPKLSEVGCGGREGTVTFRASAQQLLCLRTCSALT